MRLPSIKIAIAVGLAGFSMPYAAPSVLGCGIEWKKPTMHFEGVNEFGAVSYWEQLGELDFGEGIKFPLILGFRSDWGLFPQGLGDGWFMGILDSVFLQRSSDAFDMIQPDGYTVAFGRDGKSPSILNGAKGWKAEIKGDTISAYASCGWKLVFLKGKIDTITAPNHRSLRVQRDSNGAATAIVDGSAILLKVRPELQPGSMSLAFGDTVLRLKQVERPVVQSLNGVRVVAARGSSLGSIQCSGHTLRSFDYTPDPDLHPTISIRAPDNPPRVINWDPATRHILSDGDWKYLITPPATAGQNAAITRTNSAGESEFWHYDAANGRETTTAKGISTIQTWFTSGILAGKPRNITRVRGKTSEVLYTASYDEAGNFLRGSFADGNIVTMEGTRKVQTMRVNGVPRLSTYYNDDGTIAREVFHDQKSEKFYTYKNGEKTIITVFANGDRITEQFNIMHQQIRTQLSNSIH